MSRHNAVAVFDIGFVEIQVLQRHAGAVIKPGVAIHAKQTLRCWLQRLWLEDEVGRWRGFLPNLLVQHRGTAPADTAPLQSEYVHAFAQAEVEALDVRHGGILVGIKGEPALAMRVVCPTHACQVETWVAVLLRPPLLGCRRATDLLEAGNPVSPGEDSGATTGRSPLAHLHAAADAVLRIGRLLSGALVIGQEHAAVDIATLNFAELLGAAVLHAVPEGTH
mmetsp:Transcript_131726/g.409467  ORF Transcript_131726/g.409467 Transcript_131726/m.409467 type:complete len:222 (-) Transcript_131726:285-950(-)